MVKKQVTIIEESEETVVSSSDADGNNNPKVPPPPNAVETTTQGTDVWDRAIRMILYVLTFLIPVLFTPWTFEPLEFSKQMFLFFGISAALVAWLLKLLVLRSWRFVKTPLDVPIGVFVLIYFLAALFSVDRTASFLGFYGTFSGNFFQVLFLVLFYYLVVNNINSLRELKRLLAVFFFSLTLTVLYALLQFFGVFVAPFEFTKVQSFNTVGNLITLSLFAAFVAVMSIGGKSKSWFLPWFGNAWRILAVVASFFILLAINFLYAWIALLIGLIAYIVFHVAFGKDSFSLKDVVAPLVLVVFTVSFLLIQLVFGSSLSVREMFNLDISPQVRLDYETAAPVIKNIVSDQPIFGSGPNTFSYAFSQYRDQNFNLSPFWNINFDRAPSEAAEFLVASGILGFLAFEILALIFLLYGIMFLMRKRGAKGFNLAAVFFAGFAVLWFAHWFFFFNTTLSFSFWLMIAGFMTVVRLVGGERVETRSFSFTTSPRQTVGIVTSVSIALVLVIVFVFFTASVYAADIFYRKGLVAGNDLERLDEAQGNFEQAISLNRFRPDYYLTYGEFLIARINQELVKEEPNTANIQQWLQGSINTARAAVDLSPNNWTAWERLANLYTLARPLVAGVDQFIIESLQRATENSPSNPILYTELGQVYRLSAQQIDPNILGSGADTDQDGLSDAQEQRIGSNPQDPDTNGNNVLDGDEVLSGLNPASTGSLPADFLNEYTRVDQEQLLRAAEAFEKAIELKEDYATPYYQLALTRLQQGNVDAAIQQLEDSLQRFPGNVTIKFELGRQYFNQQRFEDAARQFREIVLLVPNHANSRFSLALSYQQLGRLDEALRELRTVQATNPDNPELERRIQEIEAQLQAPIEE